MTQLMEPTEPTSNGANDETAPTNPVPAPELHISQIVVQLGLVNEYHAPAQLVDQDGQPKHFSFVGNADGTAIEHMIAWANNIAAQLALAGSQGVVRDVDDD